MAKKTKTKKPKRPPVTLEDSLLVRDYILKHDFALWASGSRATSYRSLTERLRLEFKIPHLTLRIVRDVAVSCTANRLWWKTVPPVRRRAPCETKALDEAGWIRLRRAVRDVAYLIKDLSLEDARKVVSTVCPCNMDLLEGLESTYHVWRKE